MKHKLLLILLALCIPWGARADVEIDGIYYNLITKAKQAEVTNGGTTGQYSGNIVIPSSVTYEGVTYSVTTIYSEAFKNCYSLTGITIPNSVTSIGSYAFYYCYNLTSVTIPNSVTTIGSYAFEGCSRLTSVTIPNSVTTIGSGAFYNCSSLASVTIPSSVTSIGSYAFCNCSSLTSVTIPNSVSYINEYTFYKCTSLATVSIPNTIIAIGGYAFYGCTSLTSVEIPNSVKYIGGSAFYECNELKEVSLGSGVINIGTRSYYYDDEGNYHSLNNNGNSFALCKNLETVKCLAESVPTTNANTFDQSLVEYATLCVPEGSVDSYKAAEPWSSFGTIKSLTDDGSNDPILVDGIYFTFDEENGTATVVAGDVAYTGEVVIPSTVTYDGKEYSVTAIAEKAFQGCSGLTSVYIPESVAAIGDFAFDGCGNLTYVTVELWTRSGELPTINATTFSNMANATFHIDGLDGYCAYEKIKNKVWDEFGTIDCDIHSENYWSEYAIPQYDFTTDTEEGARMEYVKLTDTTCQAGANLTDVYTLQYEGGGQIACGAKRKQRASAKKKVSPYDDNANTITIPSTVNGLTVTRIGAHAFDSYTGYEGYTDADTGEWIEVEVRYVTTNNNLTAVYIPATVTEIASGTATREVKYKNPLGLMDSFVEEYIGYPDANTDEGAFTNCPNLRAVVVGMAMPVAIEANAFGSYDGTLYVPAGSKAAYMAAANWSRFADIVEYSGDIDLNSLANANGIYYSYDTESYNATVTGAAEGMTEVNIPDFVVHDGKTYAVTAIAKEAFIDHGMTSVIVPYTMTDIGYDAFRGCKNLTSMAVEDYHSYLVQLAPPRVEGLVDVDGTKDPAAKRAQGDLRVYGDADGNGAYDSRNGCNAIIRTANNTLVAGCQTTVIPDDVETIYDHAFYGHTNLKAIDIPASVKAIRSGAFYGCTGLETVTFNEGLEAIDNYAFYGCSKLTSLYIPSTVTSIDLNAFKNCTGLAKVVAPDIAAWCAISFGKDANPLANAEHLYIDENTEVTELAIPQGVTAVGNYAFYNAKAITSVTIPATVTELGGYAFYGCDNLTSVTVAWAEPITIGSSRFSNRANAILYVPTGTKALYEAADYWKEFKEIHEVAIDGTVLIDGIYYALDGTSGTATVVSGDNTYTGSVTIPAQIEYGGVTYPVTAIGIKAFQGCGELTSIDIPSSIVTIDDYAFQGCSSLAEVNIPASVTTLGGYAFDSCGNLASVTVNWTDAGSIPAIGKSRFPNRANMTLYVPKGTKALYEAADYWKEFKEIVEMEDDTIEVTDISEMDNAIYIEPLEARAGETVALDIQMKNTLSPVGCTFRLTLPEGFSLQKDEDGDLVYEMGSRAKKMSVVYMASDGRTFDFSLTPLSGTATITGTEGTFITLQLEVPEGTPTGNYEILLTRNLIESKDDTNMTIENALTDIVSAVTITDYLLGDVNGDGNVTPADAIMILYHYFGVEQTGFIFKAADVNGDGNITPADAIEVLYIYFNAGRSNSPAFTNQTLDPQ